MTFTNGQPDSILDLPEDQQEAIREERWAAEHGDCEICGETLCLAGNGCGCGELEGLRIPGTLTIAVHAGSCHVTHQARERFERQADEVTRRSLLDDIREGLLVFRQRGVAISDDLIDERVNNICTGLLGNYVIQRRVPIAVHRTKPVGHLESCECEGCK